MKHPTPEQLIDSILLERTPSNVSGHLPSCSECRSLAEELRTALEGEAEGIRHRVASKPESFWERQRSAIVTRMLAESRPVSRGTFARGFAWALVMALAIAALAVSVMPPPAASIPDAAASTDISADSGLFQEDLQTYDPWTSDELSSFHQVVEWENWVVEPASTGGENNS